MKSPAQPWTCRQTLHPGLTSIPGYWLVSCASIAKSNATGIHHAPTASRPMSPARPVRRRQPANAGARIKISKNALLDVRSCSSSMQADLCRFLALLLHLLHLLHLLLSARCHRCRPHRPTQTCQPPKPSLPRRPASILLSLGIQAPSWSRKTATFDSWIATFGLVSTTSYRKCGTS